MCVEDGYTEHVVCIRLGTNGTRVRVPLNTHLVHITQIRLHEYAIAAPNGSSLSETLWRLNFIGDMQSAVSTNAGGAGYPLVIDNASMTHVRYDEPRVMFNVTKPALNFVEIELKTPAGADVTFADATFYVGIVCRDPEWSDTVVMARHHLQPVDNIDNDGRVPGLVGDSVAQNVLSMYYG